MKLRAVDDYSDTPSGMTPEEQDAYEAARQKEYRRKKAEAAKGSSRRILSLLICAGFVIATLFLLQSLVVPKYEGDVVEGNFIAEYYRSSNKDHDVIFVGDCEVYENFSPQVLWNEYGINSCIRGTAQQLVNQSYYILEDTFRYEKPDVVVFSVLAVALNEPAKESYNRMTLDGMKWSSSKLKAIKTSMTEDEQLLDYIFPLLRYHSRITDLTDEDFRYLLHRDTVSHEGYYMRVDAKPAENVPSGRPLADYTLNEDQMYWLDQIRLLCEENGVKLMLIKAPSLYPYWYDQWDDQISAYAEEHDLFYVNLLAQAGSFGLDYTTDTYDGGLHMNLSGAEKLTSCFGVFLRNEYGLEDRSGETALAEYWKQSEVFYQEDMLTQSAAIGR